MTKIKSNLLTLFSSTLIFLFVFSSVPQALAQSENLGKLEFGTQPSKGWVSNLNSKKALDVLKSDMVELSPTFVFETPSKKGVLFGTWKEFKPGVAFNAEGLNAEPPPVPKEWGKVDMKIFPQTNSDLSYAGFTVQGMGDTTSFVKKTSQTAGAWIDIPMTYTDPTGPHSGLASLYFRGPLNEYTGPNGGEKLIQKILSELQIQQGVKLIAFQDYKKLFAQAPPVVMETNNELTTSPSTNINQAPVINSGSKNSNQDSLNLIKSINDLIKSNNDLIKSNNDLIKSNNDLIKSNDDVISQRKK
jgi:hypothetical protein